jgi:hypothetical protein
MLWLKLLYNEKVLIFIEHNAPTAAALQALADFIFKIHYHFC